MRRAAQSLSSAVRSPPLLRLLRPYPAQAPSGDDLLPLRTRGFVRRFSSSLKEEDEIALEEEAQKKAAWLFKSIFILTAGFAAYQFFPYMGDNLLHQSISLLRVRDPLFKRMGASRLTRYAVDDERRMRVVEMGGAKELLNVLQAATDDKTRKETLKALVALSKSDEAARFLHQAGAVPIVSSISNSSEFAEVETHKTSLLEKFEKIKS
ncbi:ARM repeat superfamily protein [Rhynchospora pubera]|uniref:ARM repeat superfamily protein n=1 Tax=Rhynchospora pubera TaxID=906938 RepID=A0AAV8EXL9_9POAL|nr:ARM repeat superfamily protein [Rhynchospora pubera]